MNKLFGALLYLGAFLFIVILVASEAFMPIWELAIWIIVVLALVLVFDGKGKQ